MDPLIEQAAEADGVQSNAPLLGPDVGSDVELAAGVAIRMTIQARHAQAGLNSPSIAGRVAILLEGMASPKPQAIELYGCQEVLEQAVIVVDRDHFASGDIAQLGPALQKHRRRKLGQKGLGEVELNVVPLQPRKHLDLHRREDLATQPATLGDVRQRFIREDVPVANFGPGLNAASASDVIPAGNRAVGPTDGLARHCDDRVELRFRL